MECSGHASQCLRERRKNAAYVVRPPSTYLSDDGCDAILWRYGTTMRSPVQDECAWAVQGIVLCAAVKLFSGTLGSGRGGFAQRSRAASSRST